MNNDVVMIQLDRPRELRYGHKALKTLVALTGKPIEQIEAESMGDFDIMEKLVFCGLMKDARENGETLKPEDMEDLLDQAPNYAHIMDKVQQAFLAAFGPAPEGNKAPATVPGESESPMTGEKASK